jgi:lipopolysaccharide/colanic/teichoic acid biosynthesis glycosyltransferase
MSFDKSSKTLDSAAGLNTWGDAAATVSIARPHVRKSRPVDRRNRHLPHDTTSHAGHAPDDFSDLLPCGNRRVAYLFIKRSIDILGAVVAFLLFSPVMLAALVVLLITTRGRPLFSQQRIGFCGRRFKLYKFRTMRLDADKLQHLVANEKDGPIFKNRRDPRVTRFGRFLRSFSIDEMPQLWNVLRGDMSLVGPRPLPTPEALKCHGRARLRFAIKPGLTCLWQVSGRSDVDFRDLVRMDLWYLRRQSLRTDLALLARTPLCVLSCKGAY